MITVAIGANAKHRDFALFARTKARALGYNVVLFDLGGLGEGEKIEAKMDFARKEHVFFSAYFKLRAVHQTLLEHEKVIFTDADVLINQPVDEVFEDDFNLGLTIRPSTSDGVIQDRNFRPESCKERRYGFGYFNTGVMFFQQNPETFKCLETWKKCAMEVGSEQAGMNMLVMPHMDPWDPRKNPVPPKFVDIPDGRVRIFNMTEYNYTIGGPSMNTLDLDELPKITHYKNRKKHIRILLEGAGFSWRKGEHDPI